jgi:hypothetical protein
LKSLVGGSSLGGLKPQEFNVLAPGQFANDPLANFCIRPSRGEGLHIAQVCGRKAPYVREFGLEVNRQAVDDPGAETADILALKDIPADP